MSFSYQPITKVDADIARYNLLPPGLYWGVVMQMTPKKSLAGNQMIEVVIKAFSDQGDRLIYDYLVFIPTMQWKCIDFCEAAGLQKEYESGTFLPEHALNKEVKIKIGIKKGQLIPTDKLNGKHEGSLYPDKNIIESYFTKDKKTFISPKDNDFDDVIPF